jgi:hypothetical protein
MNIASRVLDNIVKNIYVKLVLWFLFGAATAIVFFMIVRGDS